MFELSRLKKLALGVVGAVLSVVMSASADITVNGERIGDSHTGGTGWTFDEFAYPKTLSLTGAGPFTLSGSDDHEIHIAVEADCAVTASNLSVAVSGKSGCAAFAISSDGFGHGNHSVALTLVGTNRFCSGNNAAGISVGSGHALTIDGTGYLEARGGERGAGIGASSDESVGTITISGGTVEAWGGSGGAGIGGSYERTSGMITTSAGTITISGGTVSAYGGEDAAGIGNGRGLMTRQEGNIVISGGRIYAQGGGNAAAIGGGQNRLIQSVTISGGTVIPVAGANASCAVGCAEGGSSSTDSGTVAFTGGSVMAAADDVEPAPTNAAGVVVHPVTVTGLEPGSAVKTKELTLAEYGMNDVYADSTGSVRFWFPNGIHSFNIGPLHYEVSVSNDEVNVSSEPIPVTIDTVVTLDETSAGLTLAHGTVYVVSTNLTLSGDNGQSALKVAEDATAAIVQVFSLSALSGANR